MDQKQRENHLRWLLINANKVFCTDLEGIYATSKPYQVNLIFIWWVLCNLVLFKNIWLQRNWTQVLIRRAHTRISLKMMSLATLIYTILSRRSKVYRNLQILSPQWNREDRVCQATELAQPIHQIRVGLQDAPNIKLCETMNGCPLGFTKLCDPKQPLIEHLLQDWRPTSLALLRRGLSWYREIKRRRKHFLISLIWGRSLTLTQRRLGPFRNGLNQTSEE